MNILSLGAGVQSTTMAIMYARKELSPMPSCAIFADTGWESDKVYSCLSNLQKILPFPVHIVKFGNIKEDTIAAMETGKFSSIPFYTQSDAKNGGLLRRQCTREYKLTPITQKIRSLLGLKKGQRAKDRVSANLLIGISTDEAHRMKDNREPWISNIYPLCNEIPMSRTDCIDYLKTNGYPEPAKSSCIGCPYRDNMAWRNMKMNDPKSWEEAVLIDELIRDGTRGRKEKLYIHASLTPLSEIDFRTLEDKGQMRLEFGEECEGLCGT